MHASASSAPTAPVPPPTPRRPGRPLLLTPATLSHLLQAIAANGWSDSAAAEYIGLSSSSLSRWKQQIPELALKLQQARQQFRSRQIDLIITAAQKGGWRAAAWLLERVFPEDYSPRAHERAQFQALAEAPPDFLQVPALTKPSAAQATSGAQRPQPPISAATAAGHTAAPTAATTSSAEPVIASDTPSHNSQNSAPVTAEYPLPSIDEIIRRLHLLPEELTDLAAEPASATAASARLAAAA